MNVELISISSNDRNELAAFYSSEDWPFHSGPPLTPHVINQRWKKGHYTGDGIRTFWILADGRREGVIRLWDLGQGNDTETPLFDIRIRSTARGRGIGTEAVRHLVKWVFTAYPAKTRIEATTRQDNVVMQSILRRIGFVKEAHYRQCWPGEHRRMYDCCGFGILRSDWEQEAATPVECSEGNALQASCLRDFVVKTDAMWIMIAGPYRSGTGTDEERKDNLRELNRVALEICKRGHIPVIGVNMALPMIEVAGEETYDDIMMPISLALAERCDGILRIGGESRGANREVEVVLARGGRLFGSVDDIPAVWNKRQS